MFDLYAFATQQRQSAAYSACWMACWPPRIRGRRDFTIADIAHVGRMWRREFAGVTFDATPHVARWFGNVAGRLAVQRAIVRVNALVPQAWPKPGKYHRHWTHDGKHSIDIEAEAGS